LAQLHLIFLHINAVGQNPQDMQSLVALNVFFARRYHILVHKMQVFDHTHKCKETDVVQASEVVTERHKQKQKTLEVTYCRVNAPNSQLMPYQLFCAVLLQPP
tara:strand:- start:2220 stop:2528 length:309 start_codon:yes stop_codon:yes gene_type:complete